MNVHLTNRDTRYLRSGRYITMDVLCIKCQHVLGFYYEYAFDPSQKEKEGKACLQMRKLRGGDEKAEEKQTVVNKNTQFLLTSNGNLHIATPHPLLL